MENINKGMLHRAFSVFLFNSEGKLLLQQRSADKITFPSYWTNTCCSHPLYVPGELEEENAIGVRRAAQRKLLNEMGIKPEQLPLDEFNYLTRIWYKAPSDGLWGEHEVDYILFMQRDVDFVPNPEEVRDAKYFSKEELKAFIQNAQANNIPLTPWFALIAEDYLWGWWDALLDGTLESKKDHKTVHNMVK